ncbi:MAG: hypothetical protein IJL44_07405 [Bacteroidales bacterium]|nr:hypothetical protein [Bacteroidales bacterium]
MSDNVVKFTINLGGNAYNGFVNLGNAVSDVTTRVGKLKSAFGTLSKYGLGLSGIINALEKITAKTEEFVTANNMQQEAETKLAQVMRNTMGATTDQIQSIKDLASAQQKLGIIGDEVQLSGAQELATYLSKTESLQKLMPVMNDMMAQQYGLNASQEQSVQIASMMGKVMDGQVGALSRYGYRFTEAQEKILKFGTEEQRVATLADVITQSVGGMNEALANTPEGKMKQAANKIGDIKERIGHIIVDLRVKLLPVLEKVLKIADKLLNGAEQLIGFIQAHMPAILGIAGTLGIYYAVRRIRMELSKTSIAALLTGGSFDTMAVMAKAACRAISTAIKKIPIIGWIAAAIALVIELVDQLWKRCEGFREFLFGSWEALKTSFLVATESAKKIWEAFKTSFTFVKAGARALWDDVTGSFNRIGEWFNNVMQPVHEWFDNLWNRLSGMFGRVKALFDKVGSWFNKVMQPVNDWFDNLLGQVKSVIDRILEWLGKVFNPIIELWNRMTGQAVKTYSTAMTIEAKAYARGAKKGRESFAKDKEGKTTMESLLAQANSFSGDEFVKNAGKTAETVATGGTRNTTVNINLGKMVESINFNGGYEQNEQDMEQRLAAMLSRILGMAEATAG